MSKVSINYVGVQDACSSLDTEADKIDVLNGDLTTLQNKMKTFWESEESVAFHAGYDKFQKTLDELSTVIRSISKWGVTTKDNFKENENKGAQFYGSIF